MTSFPITLQKRFLRWRFSFVRQQLSGDLTKRRNQRAKRLEFLYKKYYYLPKKSINQQIDALHKPLVIQASKAKPLPANQPISRLRSKPRTKRILQARLPRLLFSFFFGASAIVLGILLLPFVYYKIFPEDSIPVAATESGTPLGGSFIASPSAAVRTLVRPPYDEDLPDGNWITIPKIGVKTEILESQKSEDALSQGVWRVPEFGTPGDLTKPMILVAHRYGYENWWGKSQYWKYHSFYLLPELQPGDLVEVIADKRKYTYEVYKGEEGEEISDYQADLILYTCKFLNSPRRHFRYLRLVNFNQNTQPAQISLAK